MLIIASYIFQFPLWSLLAGDTVEYYKFFLLFKSNSQLLGHKPERSTEQWRNVCLTFFSTFPDPNGCTSLSAPPFSFCVSLYLLLSHPENSLVHSNQLNVDSTLQTKVWLHWYFQRDNSETYPTTVESEACVPRWVSYDLFLNQLFENFTHILTVFIFTSQLFLVNPLSYPNL